MYFMIKTNKKNIDLCVQLLLERYAIFGEICHLSTDSLTILSLVTCSCEHKLNNTVYNLFDV